jgi:hypothetical protein
MKVAVFSGHGEVLVFLIKNNELVGFDDCFGIDSNYRQVGDYNVSFNDLSKGRLSSMD